MSPEKGLVKGHESSQPNINFQVPHKKFQGGRNLTCVGLGPTPNKSI